MEDEKYFGVLMVQRNISDSVFAYFPERLVEGNIVDQEGFNLFVDMYGNNYLLLEDSYCDDEEAVIGYLIKEKDLIKYNTNVDEIKAEYFDAARNRVLFGIYDIDRDDIDFLSLSILEFGRVLSNVNKEDKYTLYSGEKLTQTVLEEMKDLYNCQNITDSNLNHGYNDNVPNSLIMTIKSLDKLLELDPNTLKNEMCHIRKEYEELYESNFENIDDDMDKDKKNINEEIYDVFSAKTYNYIQGINNPNTMIKCLELVANVYMEFIIYLGDELKENTEEELTNKETIINFYNNYSLSLHTLLKFDNIDSIKKTLMIIRNDYANKAREFGIEETIMNFIETNECYILAKSNLEKLLEEEKNVINSNGLFSVKEMKAYFDKKIIGQEEAKVAVISSLFMNGINSDSKSKSSCLLIGPTGSGKTLIAKTVSEYLNLPFVTIDTTQLTMPGYKGEEIETFLERLVTIAGGDLEKAEHGIVLFDEIDKKGSKENGDVSGRGVLNTLLPFYDGTVYSIAYKGRCMEFDTSNLTIFATGAFTNVAESMNHSNSIGFNSFLDNKKEDIVYKKIEIEDLVKLGDIPRELVGRITTIVQLSGHTKESLIKIMTDSDISILLKEQEKLSKVNINLKWNNEYLEAVADKALKLKTGARSIKTTVEKSIMPARYEAISELGNITDIVLNKEAVEDPNQAILVYKDGGINTVGETKNNRGKQIKESKQILNKKV